MANYIISSAEKGNVKLIEFSDPDSDYLDKIFIQVGICGLYIKHCELRDLATVVNYYLNMEEIDKININVGGEHVAP